LALAALGWIRSLMCRPTVTELYFLVSIDVVLLFSSGRTPRYLLPVMPILLIYTVKTVWWAAKRYFPSYQRWAVGSLFAVLSLGIVLNVLAVETGPIRNGPETPAFHQICAFIRNNTAPDNVFVFWNPRVLVLYTDRKAAWYVHTTDDARFDKYLSRIHASYVVSHRDSEDNEKWLRPHIERMPARFQPVYENTRFQVYKVLH
jgi:hypothetical protein